MSLLLALTGGGGSNTQVTVGVGNLTLTGYAPSIAQSANQSVLPLSGSLSLTGYAPSIAQSANQAVSPSVGSLTITGYAPSVVQAGGSISVTPDTGFLTITGYAPDVVQSGEALQPAGRSKRSKKVFIERDGKYLVFENEREAQVYESVQKPVTVDKAKDKPEVKAVAVKPEIVPIVDNRVLDDLIARFNLEYNLQQLQKQQDYEQLIYIQRHVAMLQDEEDIELLLLAA